MADDLISRQAAIKLLLGECVAKYPCSFYVGLFAAADELSKLAAVDSVEVVRCGECLHRYTGLRPNCHGRRPDWFCADGIKRPGAERRGENAAD